MKKNKKEEKQQYDTVILRTTKQLADAVAICAKVGLKIDEKPFDISCMDCKAEDGDSSSLFSTSH